MKLASLVKNITKHKIAEIKKIKMSLEEKKSTWQKAFAPIAAMYFPNEYKKISDIEEATARSLEEN